MCSNKINLSFAIGYGIYLIWYISRGYTYTQDHPAATRPGSSACGLPSIRGGVIGYNAIKSTSCIDWYMAD